MIAVLLHIHLYKRIIKNIFKKMKENVRISKLKKHMSKMGWYLSNKINITTSI